MDHTPAHLESSAEPGKVDRHITARAIAIGGITIAAIFYGIDIAVKSQLPLIVIGAFMMWLFVNILLKWLMPAVALSRSELLTIFGMLWVAGTISGSGWMSYWALIMATPAYFDSAENQWADTIFDFMPWHVFPETDARVIDAFWLGLPEGAPIPWDGWLGAAGQWFTISVALVVFGFCIILLFQRQWEEKERLAFPLAQVPVELTAGVDGPRAVPEMLRSRLFWCGFLLIFVPILYSIVTYFIAGLPPLDFYWIAYDLKIGGSVPDLWVRILPMLMIMLYLCPLDILGSFILFYFLAVVKGTAMQRIGFSVGSEGHVLGWEKILQMEAYGAQIFVALWSIWLARSHLRRIWVQARSGDGDPNDVVRYRLAFIGLAASSIFIIAWQVSIGMNLALSIAMFLLTTLIYFLIAKLVAATGFSYLLPDWDHMKGKSFILDLVGTNHISPQGLVAFSVVTSHAYFGNFRVSAWPAIPHILKMFPVRRQLGKVAAMVAVAFTVGFASACVSALSTGYIGGGMFRSVGAGVRSLDYTVDLILNPRLPDFGRWGVWLFGFCEGIVLAIMRARFHWFPLHPIGLAFQYTPSPHRYWATLLIVWWVKFALLRYGGPRAYETGKRFFYGLAVGYVMGALLSDGVDYIWFPLDPHIVHTW